MPVFLGLQISCLATLVTSMKMSYIQWTLVYHSGVGEKNCTVQWIKKRQKTHYDGQKKMRHYDVKFKFSYDEW